MWLKRAAFPAILILFFGFFAFGQAERRAEEILKGIVKVRALIPKDAQTASTLGTEREGNGVVIDSEGPILTTGYLILEAESIEVTTSEGKRVEVTIPGLGAIATNVFIPIDLLEPILSDLKTVGRPRAAARPWLGINVEETRGRLIVSRLSPKGPAHRAGLKVGDVLLKVKGETASNLADFYRKVWSLGRAGVEVPLSVLQGVEIREITIRSGDRYGFLTLRPKKI